MEFDKINFKLNDFLQPTNKFPRDWVRRRLWVTPEPLYVLCSYVADDTPNNHYFTWTNMDVLKWIEKLGFPEYRNTFYQNMINGRTLLLVDPTALCHMNIKDFDHIQIIAKAIRDLYKVEKILWKRSISLPPRYPDTHFKLYRVCTGPTYERTTKTQLWNKMKILQDKPSFRNHWIDLTQWLKHIPVEQTHRIGYAPRHKLYSVKQSKLPPAISVESVVDEGPCCKCCMPPCECSWKERYYEKPWILNCLLEENELNSLTDIADGDIVVTLESNSTNNEEHITGIDVKVNEAEVVEGTDNVPSFNNNIATPAEDVVTYPCCCLLPYECQWTARNRQPPYVLSILRCYDPILCEQVLS